ncbi:Inner membrane protein YbhN [Crateriforma conspicua]|uniref:Inner membrane protein YbhN n=1 Tax=Crateriforma conspicua TaxID=2527996 RepID=A0A5C5Y0V5_9PLAN|nr:Inner membrane protein YbhN [Crateriforma conspicua]
MPRLRPTEPFGLIKKHHIRNAIGPVFAIGLFLLAIRLLIHEAQEITWEEFKGGLIGVDPMYLGIAAFLVALNYGLLTCYDILALRYVLRPLPLPRVMLVSFLGFSLGNNLGTLLAAAPIRYRYYRQFGLSHHQLMGMMSVLALTFWSGLAWLGGTVLILSPIQLPADIPIPFGTRTLGVGLLTIAVAYTALCFLWRKPWPIGKLHLRLPQPGLAIAQASVAAVDLIISAMTLYLCMPSDANVPFPLVLSAFLVAITISIITQVPGGLGVLELILYALLKDTVGKPVLAAVLIFRVLYFFLPLVFGMITLVAHEIYVGALEAKEAKDEINHESQAAPRPSAKPESASRTPNPTSQTPASVDPSEAIASGRTGTD